MAMLPNVFNTSEVEEDEVNLLPEGWYTAQIVKSEIKDTKSGGKYLSLHFKIVEGDYAKRMVFANLNIVNANETTVKIAMQHLKKIATALGIEEFQYTSELHGQDLQIRVKTQAATSNFPAKDDVKDFKAA
jgi:hypothetical protein